MVDESRKKQRLLIVDDSRVIRVTARKILQNHFETVEAIDGENAWELLNNDDPFSLVVSDLTMPNLDGYGLLERIRSAHIPHIRDVPVIIITGANDSESTKERATQAGATDFIGKPFDSVHLLARTQAHASAHTTTRKLTAENIELEAQALTDQLTGLANEAAFMDQGYQQLSYAIRHNTSLAVFRLEIDGFGALFKQHGKDTSNSIIKSVATVLQSGIRYEDMVARTGTARFSLLLPGMDTTGIHNLAERINHDISARILKQGENRIHYTVSIGVAAPAIRRDTRFEELLSMADSRLVYASSRGGNQVIFKTPAPSVPTPPEQAPVQVTVPILLDEDISAMISQPVDAGIAHENINFASDGSLANNDRIILDETNAVESRATQEPDELPSLFAGPVPELPIAAATRAEMHMQSAAGHAAFRFDDEADNETIIITAPFDMDDPYNNIQTEKQPGEETPVTDSIDDLDSGTEVHTSMSNSLADDTFQVADYALHPEEANDSLTRAARPGFFRRLWSNLGALFRRRSRQPG